MMQIGTGERKREGEKERSREGQEERGCGKLLPCSNPFRNEYSINLITILWNEPPACCVVKVDVCIEGYMYQVLNLYRFHNSEYMQ